MARLGWCVRQAPPGQLGHPQLRDRCFPLGGGGGGQKKQQLLFESKAAVSVLGKDTRDHECHVFCEHDPCVRLFTDKLPGSWGIKKKKLHTPSDREWGGAVERSQAPGHVVTVSM